MRGMSGRRMKGTKGESKGIKGAEKKAKGAKLELKLS